jgi:hypothetical protein
MELTNEIIEKNFNLFKTKIESFGVSEGTLSNVFGDKLKTATFAMDAKSGAAMDGSLLNIVLRLLIPTALKINDVLSDDLKVSKEKIVKVGLLQHLSKAFMFEKNDNQWEIEKRGLVYKFTPSKYALKLGARSIAVANELGVSLTEEDIEAMLCLDKDVNDEQSKLHSSPLAVVMRQANEIVLLELMK